jgi:bacillolysin
MRKLLLCLPFAWLALAASAQSSDRNPDRPQSPQMILGDGSPYAGDARTLFTRYLPLRDVDELRLIGKETDALGFVHERYAQYYRKVRVEGGEYLIHLRNGSVSSLTGDFRNIPDLDVVPALSADRALQDAMRHVGAVVYAWEPAVRKGYPGYEGPKGELVVWDGPLPGKSGPRLAWKLDIYAQQPLYRAHVFVDARTGKILAEHPLIHDANAPSSGTTLYNGTQAFTADLTSGVYKLRSTATTGGVETYSLGNGTSYTAATDVTSTTSVFTSDPTANQAHWGAEKTLTYYKALHNRSSYNNQGATLKSYVHYSTNYVNAFWDGSRMTYGDGNGTTYRPLVSLDIVGHEITHGVTQFSANLAYQNESGALNESFSDIFGEAVENFAKGTNDWLMGCDIGVNGCGAIRNMKNPNAFSDPDTYGGAYWYSGTADNGGVHTNSGVQNKWFYILTVGETGTNDLGAAYSVAGIGLQKAAAIAYRNLAFYLTSSSSYANARSGAIQAATDLYGAGSPEVVATTNAWHAVGVGCAYGQICYCISKGNSQADEWIAGVTIGSFSNTSTASAYTFFSTKTVTLTPGLSHSVTLVPGYSATAFPEYWRIWIDLNRDSDFEDVGELVYDAGSAAAGNRTGSFTVPATATGSTRMRVSMKYNAAPTTCEAFSYGEVEDYPVTFGAAPPPDTQAPSAPVLSSPSKTTNAISLSWTASTDNVGVAGYDVFVNNVKNNTANLTGTSYTVTGLSSNTAYTLFIRARDAAGNTAQSNSLSVTTLADTQAPSAPVLSSPSKTTNSISLSWTVSTDNVGVAGYDVYVNNVKRNATNLTGTTYAVTGLAPQTAYTLFVRARDAVGNTAQSNTLSVTTLADTLAPTAPILSSPSKTTSRISLSWTASTDNVGVAGYDVYVNSVKHNTSNLSGTSYTVTGLSPNTAYTIFVRARDAAGNTSQSNALSVTTLADTQAPTAPTLSSPSKTTSSISLSWTASTDNVSVAGYDVYVNNVKSNTANITGTTYAVTGLASNTAYTLFVRARDAAGNSAQSNTLSVTTSAPVVETHIGSYYFPSNLDGWTSTSVANGLWTNNSALAWEGPGSMMLRGSGTRGVSPVLKMRGQSQTEFRMYFTPRSFESGKTFTVQYSRNSGSSYTTVATMASGAALNATTFVNNGGFYLLTLTLNGIIWTDSVRFRIQVNGADTSDRIYFDAITVKGRTNTAATGTSITLAAATKPTGFTGWDVQDEISPGTTIRLYPNPVRNRLQVSGVSGIRTWRVFSLGGSQVASSKGEVSPELSRLPQGTYLVEIQTIEGTIHRGRFVKD